MKRFDFRGFFASRRVRAAGAGASLSALVVLLFYLVNLILAGAASRMGWYIAPKGDYDLSLSGATDALFADLPTDTPIDIVFCDLEENVKTNTQLTDIRETAVRLAEKHPGLFRVSYVNLWLEPAKVAPYRQNSDGSENTIARTTVIVARGSEFLLQEPQAFYTLDSDKYVTAYNGEEAFAAAALWVSTDTHSAAYLTENHGESVSASLYRALTYAGYRVKTIDLASDSAVPDDAGLLVISSPLYDFQSAAPGSGYRAELEKLRDYLARGGSLFVTLDPRYTEKQPHLCAFFAEYGITPDAGILQAGDGALPGSGGYELLASPDAGADLAAVGSRRVAVRYAATLSLSGTARPLLLSPGDARRLTDDGGSTGAGGLPVAARTETADGGRILLAGAATLSATAQMTGDHYGNKQFVYAMLTRLGARAVPAGIPAVAVDRTALENLTAGDCDRFFFLSVVLVPLLLLAAAIWIWRRRTER